MTLPRYADLRASIILLATQMPEAHARLQRIRARAQAVEHLLPLPDPASNRFLIGNAQEYIDDLLLVARKAEIGVRHVPRMKYRTALGVTEDGIIKLRAADRIELPHQAHILAHELTHALWHRDEAGKDPRLDECEAECVAHLLSSHYGCGGVADSALYLATHSVIGPTIERMAHRLVADAMMICAIAGEENVGD